MTGQELADRVHAALSEVGRSDLGQLVVVFEDDDGRPYVETGMISTEEGDEDCTPDELALIERAERIAWGL